MSRVLLVERSPFGAHVALVEDGRLLEVQGEPRGPSRVGEIHKGRVSRVVPAINAAFVEIGLERNAFLFADDVACVPEPEAELSIEDLVSPGEVLLVQIVKDALPRKGPRVTTQIALPGRLLVLLPQGGGGVSRRIVDPADRERAEALVARLAPEGAGLILRTVAAGVDEELLRKDLEALEATWSEIQRRAAVAKPPRRMYRDLGPVLRAVRDRFDARVEAVWVEGENTWREVRDYVAALDAHLVERVLLEPEEGTLFARFGVEAELRAALSPRVALPSGGHLVIEPTEALVAVDVNSGSSVEEASLERTALATNLEAAREFARQARLRDLAGLIVVDFIDMERQENRELLFSTLEQQLLDDPARTHVAEVSDFGLVSLTRKRDRSNLYRRMGRPCPTCAGRGYLRALEASRDAVWRQALRLSRDDTVAPIVVRLHPELAAFLADDAPSAREALAARLGDRVSFVEDRSLAPGEFEVSAGAAR